MGSDNSKFQRVGQVVALVGALVVAAGVALVPPAGTAAAVGTVYTVTESAACGQGETLEQAIKQANLNPGTDTIEITPFLSIGTRFCPDQIASAYPWAVLEVTESLIINGNFATIDGEQIYLSANGHINPDDCPGRGETGMTTVSVTWGFLSIGTINADNSGVDVTINLLNLTRLPAGYSVQKNASLTLNGALMHDNYAYEQSCNRPFIHGETGANVTLNSVQMELNRMPGGLKNDIPPKGLIEGGGGDLVITNSTIDTNPIPRAIVWGSESSKVTIVSSKIRNSGGLYLSGNVEIVNSAFVSRGVYPGDRIDFGSGTMKLTASSFNWGQPVSTEGVAQFSRQMGIRAVAGLISTSVELNTTAIGANPFPCSTCAPVPGLLVGLTGATFTSDALTWVQPVGLQDAAAINAILPNALTDPPGLPAVGGAQYSLAYLLSPLLGDVITPGVLIDAVPDANCGNTNQLRNPIDGSCIDKDVLGNPRVDGNNKRNIGAIQLTLAPHLSVAGTGDGRLDLAWNRPVDPPSGPVTGYVIRCRPFGQGSLVIDVVGADTLTQTVTGLTNEVEYTCEIAAVAGAAGLGPLSNMVTDTPYAEPGTPEPSATPGDGQAQVFWPEPSSGGHPGLATYGVVYRPQGTDQWFVGPTLLSARTTLIPGLTGGTTYEIGVFATWGDGVSSPIGITTVTPTATTPPTLAPILPETGTGRSTSTALIGLILVLVGAALTTVTRRRPTAR